MQFFKILSISLAAAALLTGCGESSSSSKPGVNTPATPDASAATTSAPQTPASSAQPDTVAAEEATTTYLNELASLNTVLDSVKNQMSAATATPRIQSAVGKVKDAWASLDKLNPKLKQHATDLFKSRISELTATFQAHVNRIGTELGLSSVTDLLKDIPLFPQ